MSDLEAFYIPRTLDAPTRWLFWSIDEAFMILLPFGMGLILHYVVFGSIIGLSAFIIWRRVKGKNQMNLILYLVYWYCPSGLLRLKKTPPSYNRVFLG